MKILTLIGSYRRNGNTDQFIGLMHAELQQIAQAAGVPLEIETIYLGQQNIGPCRGCRICFDRGEEKCPVKDDLLSIKGKMQAADGLLVASPLYVDDVSGITKTWIDRLAHVCHRPEFAGKSAYMVVTTGSTPTDHAMRTLTVALSTWGFHLAGKMGVKAGALMKPAAMKAAHEEKARKAARRFFDALHRQAYARPSFMSLAMFKIQQWSWQRKGIPGTVDYQYWQKQGWFEPRRDFYIPHRANPIKVALARLVGGIIARVMA